MIIRGDIVLPVSRPPIRDGAVWVSAGRIRAVSRWRDLTPANKRAAVDLRHALIMPGLINGHCHLDYTHMAGQIPPPQLFSDWLKVMVATKAGWSLEDYALSWQTGARMLLQTGTTTVLDVEAVPALLPAMWETTPLRVISFLEMIAIKQRPPNEVLNDALKIARSLPDGRCRVALSPHAPYSTVPELLIRSARVARKSKLLLTAHVAESAAEFSMFARAKGDLYEWLQRSGRNMSDCGAVSPVQHLGKAGILGRNFIAVHVNYLGKGDLSLLARSGTSVVHCPRSHFYFQHDCVPLSALARAGVNICLGSDSLVTVFKRRNETVQLDMFAEMRALRAREPAFPPRAIVRMATVNGARALRLPGKLGELSPGALADLIAIPLPAGTADPYDAVLHHQGPVLASIIGGQWASPPPG